MPKPSKQETLLLIASLTLARQDACTVLNRLKREINKTGGEIQRGQGWRLLNQAEKYLSQTCMIYWRDYEIEQNKTYA